MASLLERALAHHRAGRQAEAERLCARALAETPGDPEALYLAGMLASRAGRAGEAVARLEAACRAAPDRARYTAGLGAALRRAGRVEEALAAFARTLALDPGHREAHAARAALLLQAGRTEEAEAGARAGLARDAEAPGLLNLLALALKARGATAEAEAALRRALARAGDFLPARANLAALLAEEGRYAEALAEADAAAAPAPNDPELHANRAAILIALDRAEEAEQAARRALALDPGSHEGAVNLSAALQRAGRIEEAAAASRAGLARHPGSARLNANLGAALTALGEAAGAEAAFRRAVSLDPSLVAARNGLGALLQKLDRLGEAEAELREAVALEPGGTRARLNLSIVLLADARHGEAIAEARAALAIDPGDAAARSHLLLALAYGVGEGADPDLVLAEHRQWDERIAAPLRAAWRAHANAPDAERRLRVGYLSPDLREHSVAYFIAPVLAAHDRGAVEVACYADVVRPDSVTERLRAHADLWRSVAGLVPSAIAEAIRADRIDILVDLAGHTWPRAMLVMARKPAPLQGSWIGYPNTTGLSAMDFRITDATADPPGAAEARHVERLVRLAPAFLCYAPPAEAPAPMARAEGAPLTFASFNNVAKLSPAAIAAWARLLSAVPEAGLLLKYRGLDDPGLAARVRAAFAAEGVGPDRLTLRGRDPGLGAHFAAYHQVDVALDSFPYNGTTTTCEALWMGVPVVTLAGKTHAARVGASLLSAAGLGDLVAGDEEGYVALAAALAADRAQRGRLRAELRPRLAASPLMDASGLARALEGAYRSLWREWCLRA
ncbi:MAG: tetratricopeptide repeat protein [Proteobacteria bacterium]|nr:tetratricopeptide repeat protein [Pseudomonadota bacterium]